MQLHGVFCKKVFLKISQNPQDNTCAKSLLNSAADHRACSLIEKRPLSPKIILKGESSTGVFL